MGIETYMDKGYCLECGVKHTRDVEHHLEDLITASKDNPELRELGQDLVDRIREIRRQLDDLRVNELARKKLEQMLG